MAMKVSKRAELTLVTTAEAVHEAAQALGLSSARLAALAPTAQFLLAEDSPLTEEAAHELGKALGCSPERWLERDQTHQARKRQMLEEKK